MRLMRYAGWRCLVVAIWMILGSFCAMGQASPAAINPALPVHLTSDEGHRMTMDLLHITELRRGPEGDSPLTRLPDPLIAKIGKHVESAEAWWSQRRPEIVEDFDREIYRRVPKLTPAVQLTLSVPANANGPVPVMMEFGWNAEVLAAMRKHFTDAPWEAFAGSGASWQQQVVANGWGYAVLIPNGVQANNGEGLTQGIIGLVNKGQPHKLDDWGALRAWAWGASRALDYFETDKSVDANQVGIEGLSRYGKAALVAMAYEPCFAIGFIGSSGEGGAKTLRRKFGEQVENVASTTEYHWMAGNFLKYAGPPTPDDLPVDAHEPIALCAPRPVFISSGSQQVEGGWADAKAMFLAAVGTGPGYKLLEGKDVGATEFPQRETALIDGDLAFRQRSGGHTTGLNWPTFLAFASRYITGPKGAVQSKSTGTNPRAQLEVALTFDDLPAHGPLPAGMTRVDVINSIIRALQAAHSPPVYGFVNAKRLEDGADAQRVLQLWNSAGFPLANHSFSHMDLDSNSVDAFARDVLADEAALQEFAAEHDWHWLRFPFLREGETAEKHQAISAFLNQHEYKVAEVTLSFADYAYNEPYVRCLAKNDLQAIDGLKKTYLDAAADSLTFGVRTSHQLFQRDIKHVMLLHVGAFQTVMLSQLLQLLQERGFKLITLQEAESDPVYSQQHSLRRWDGTFLEQVIASRRQQGIEEPEDMTAKLNAVCR